MTAQPGAHSFPMNTLNCLIELNIKIGNCHGDFWGRISELEAAVCQLCVLCVSDICLHQQQEQDPAGSALTLLLLCNPLVTVTDFQTNWCLDSRGKLLSRVLQCQEGSEPEADLWHRPATACLPLSPAQGHLPPPPASVAPTKCWNVAP